MGRNFAIKNALNNHHDKKGYYMTPEPTWWQECYLSSILILTWSSAMGDVSVQINKTKFYCIKNLSMWLFSFVFFSLGLALKRSKCSFVHTRLQYKALKIDKTETQVIKQYLEFHILRCIRLMFCAP